MSAADARAYGLAVAKMVASRKFHGATSEQTSAAKRHARNDDVSEPWWEHLGSDDEFDEKIVRRMGKLFYHDVFQPALQRAWDADKSYEDIRDNPAERMEQTESIGDNRQNAKRAKKRRILARLAFWRLILKLILARRV